MTTVLSRYGFVLSFRNSFEKASHVFSLKRQLQASHLVSNTTHTPDIWFEVIWFIFPHLWTCIIRCACLGVIQAIRSNNSRYIKVSNLNNIIIAKENICTLYLFNGSLTLRSLCITPSLWSACIPSAIWTKILKITSS
jgi:hypothetical protein